MTKLSSAEWSAARDRAIDLVATFSPPDRDETSWEFVAMRDLVTVALYAVALRDRAGVDDVALGRVIVPMAEQAPFVRLAVAELTAAGHNLDTVDRDDSASVCWAWLNREWDPDAAAPRWEGLTREVGRLLPNPALDLCLHLAGNVVGRALIEERGGLPIGTRVGITGGAFAGTHGTIETPAWVIEPAGDAVAAGPPGGYMVRLDGDDLQIERVLATDLEPAPSTTPR